MSTHPSKHASRRPVLSPLSVLALGLALIAFVVMAARPTGAAAQGAAALSAPPVTPPPKTPPTYPNAPHVPIQGVPAVQSASGGPITQSDIMTFVQQHPLPQTLASDRRQVMGVQEETARQVADTLENTGLPAATMLWVAELSGHFVFPGSSQQRDGHLSLC